MSTTNTILHINLFRDCTAEAQIITHITSPHVTCKQTYVIIPVCVSDLYKPANCDIYQLQNIDSH